MGIIVEWEPNAPDAVLLSNDMGRGALAQQAHPNDVNEQCVVLRWDGVLFAQMSPPNDEARFQHRLYDSGLKDVRWIGVVRDSELVASLRPMWSPIGVDWRAMPLHYVVVSKECVVEVLAENVDLFRLPGTPLEAAAASLLS